MSDATSDPAPPNASEASPPWTRHDTGACLLVAVVGVALAVAPHVAMLARHRMVPYLADHDDVLMLGMTRAPYYQGLWSLQDAYAGPARHVPALHAWLQFVPLAQLARWVGLPMLWQLLAWRVAGGLLFGPVIYLLLRRLLSGTSRPTAWALGGTLVCLGDAGLIDGRPLFSNFHLLVHMFRGTTPMPKAGALPQYRVVGPLLNMPFLFLLLASLVPVRNERRRDMALGILGLGGCVALYFFYWTAAVIGLGMYLLAVLAHARLAPPEERGPWLAQAKVLVIVLVGGLVLGSPQVIDNSLTFRDPALEPLVEKAGRGIHLPPGDPRRSIFVRNIWLGGKLALGAAGIWMLRRRGRSLQFGLPLLWYTALAAYLLANSAIVTGLEFENFHWAIVHGAMSELLLVAVVCGLLDAVRWGEARRRTLGRLAWTIPWISIGIALAWRPYEALHAEQTVALNDDLSAVRPLVPLLRGLDQDATLAGGRLAQVAFLHTPGGLLFSDAYTYQTLVPLDEAHQRHALNAWLQGVDVPTYEAAIARETGVVPFPLGETEIGPVNEARGALFRALVDQPELGRALVESFQARYLLLPDAAPAPTRAGPWRRMDRANGWALWERSGDQPEASPRP